MSIFGGGITTSPRGNAGLTLPLFQTFREAWADPELRARILFIMGIFGVFALGINIPIPIPGVNQAQLALAMKNNPFFQLVNVFGGGALRRLSIFALGLNPYITAAIIMQILTTALPQWKKELEEGGEYARKQQNKRTLGLSLLLCIMQSYAFFSPLVAAGAVKATPFIITTVLLIWTAGAMFMVWLGEQISEKGIGNGVSLMIFAGIVISLPYQVQQVIQDVQAGAYAWYQALVLLVLFLATTWVIVYFTVAQRRIPMQHMRRQVGTKVLGGQTSYLPLPVNAAGVIPLIFAVSLLFIPAQFAGYVHGRWPQVEQAFILVATYMNPGSRPFLWEGLCGSIVYSILIFFFTYFYTAIQYNVEDISNNLKKGGSFIPGVRPGKQTKDFLDGILSRITLVGAAFLTIVALAQFLGPEAAGINGRNLNIIGATSLLIMVQVAIETMKQIEANLLMKQYGT